MKKDTFLYYQDDKLLYMFWQKDESIVRREIIGIDDLFNSKIIAETTGTNIVLEKKKLKPYFEIRVDSYDKDNNVIQNILTEKEYNKITIKCLESYEGLTLSFYSDFIIYARYDLYEIKKNKKELIMTSEDFQINSKKIKEGKKYYVEAFTRENDKYVLKAKSDIYTCQIEKIDSYTGQPKVSIIIPAYNTDLFLPRTVDSVLFSTLKEIELIIIDDGSTDKGPKIIDWYSEKYKVIVKGYHQNNQGLSYARNNGTKYATGEFIAYLDSDDIVHQGMYKELYETAIDNDSPISIGKTIVRNEINKSYILLDVPNPNNDRYRSYTYEEMLKYRHEHSWHNIFFVSVWHKIIRSDLAKKHLFSKSNQYEDSAYTPMIYSYIDKFTFAFNAWYIWEQRRRKTTGSYSSAGYQDDWKKLHKSYLEALFYAAAKGNKKRMGYILEDALIEAKNQLLVIKKQRKKSDLYKFYQKELKKYNKKYDFLSYKEVKRNGKLKRFLINILELKKE